VPRVPTNASIHRLFVEGDRMKFQSWNETSHVEGNFDRDAFEGKYD
jgi:hypothetical protein